MQNFQQTTPQMGPVIPQSTMQDAFATCNQGIANGLGQFFFNMRDPVVRRNNQPARQSPSCHTATFVTNLLFYIGLVIGIVGINRFLPIGATIGIIIGTYIIYILIAFCCGEMRQYLENMKNNDDYATTYSQMQKGAGYFTFWIQCYHYQTYRDSKGKTHRRKVVTHTATERFNVQLSVDQSGDLTSIGETRPVIFIHYLKRFYFTDDVSEANFKRSFNNFVMRHTRDTYQSYTHTFEIEGFEEFVSFTLSSLDDHTKCRFFLFTFLGVGVIFAWIAEMSIARYEVGIMKRLTVA